MLLPGAGQEFITGFIISKDPVYVKLLMINVL